MTEMENIKKHCNAIEECYEFMLAYAAQGIVDDRESHHGGQLRELLSKAIDAANDIPDAYAVMTSTLSQNISKKYQNFLEVVKVDTTKALAVMELVIAQSKISSQLIDNLNASLHIRTLLTDIFLLDEIIQLNCGD